MVYIWFRENRYVKRNLQTKLSSVYTIWPSTYAFNNCQTIYSVVTIELINLDIWLFILRSSLIKRSLHFSST